MGCSKMTITVGIMKDVAAIITIILSGGAIEDHPRARDAMIPELRVGRDVEISIAHVDGHMGGGISND
jgi:hypothetical protein